MEERKYQQLENRSTEAMAAREEAQEKRAISLGVREAMRKQMAREIIHATIEQMRESGQALTLTNEEITMLESFRRFKTRMRKDGEVFTWQTRRQQGIIVAADTAEIVHPAEVIPVDLELL